jgi:DNA (cytosine-5)-methyltransferase 1
VKLGGLFSGIGGFELAWTQLGHEVAWMCEIDKNARKVLEAQFPNVPIYEDVQQLDPAEVEAVDVLTGGSPCQGFSVAGTRSGLEHGESRLFADYIRIMNGLAERGLQWALWENVPGVLSIQNDDGEMTYEHVVAALVGAAEPVRLGQGRWNTGLADGGGRAVAWRVLDSRYFGVAQRRRRVFACVAFGGVAADRAGRALLAQPEGVRGDSSSGGSEGEGVAGGVAGRVGVPRFTGPLTTGGIESPRGTETSDSGFVFPDTAATVTSKWAKGSGGPAGSETGNLVTQPGWWDGGDTADSLTTTSDGQRMPDKQRLQAVIQPQSFNWQQGDAEYSLRDHTTALAADSRLGVPIPESQAFDEMNFTTDPDTHHVLRAGTQQSTGVLQAQAFRKAARAQSVEDDESWVADGQANTLNTFDMGDTRTTRAIVEEMVDFGRTSDRIRLNAETAATLQSGGGGAGANTGLYMTNYGVRRLTPVECERLQAFPDGWTEPAGSDSARYKALGNAVTVNTVRWVLGRMLEQS